MLTVFDRSIIVGFFVLLAGGGWIFRRFAGNSSEYFRGGGRVAWWFVGTSAFMGSFSAWTFTGAAGLAYRHGPVVLAIYAANAAALICNGLWFSPRYRQMRVIVIMEAVRARLGRGNELFFTIVAIASQILGAGIWLYSLAIFCVPVLGIPLPMIIIGCGATVTIIATLGGSWGVIASDFLQALMLFPITVVLAVSSLIATHGPAPLLRAIARGGFSAPAVAGESHYGGWWVAALFAVSFFGYNSLYNCSRALCARDGPEARKASFLSAALFAAGSGVWFVPPLAARVLGLDLGHLYPNLHVPEEAAYVAMARLYLPAGLLGLAVTGMISTTMSSMDGALNRNAGIIVRSLYQPLFRPAASERELVNAGRAATLACGAIIILVSLLYSGWTSLGVFDLMFDFSALVSTPIMVALFWCVIFRRGADWAAWSTVLVGLGVGMAVQFPAGWIPFVPLDAMLAHFLRDERYAAAAFANIGICSLWYWGVLAIRPQLSGKTRAAEVSAFFSTMDRPLSALELVAEKSGPASTGPIGTMAIIYGGLIACLILIPNALGSRVAIGLCGAFVAGAGFLLRSTSGRR